MNELEEEAKRVRSDFEKELVSFIRRYATMEKLLKQQEVEIASLKSQLEEALENGGKVDSEDLACLRGENRMIVQAAFDKPVTISDFTWKKPRTARRYFDHLVRLGWLRRVEGTDYYEFRKERPRTANLNAEEKRAIAVLRKHGPLRSAQLEQHGVSRQSLPRLAQHRVQVVEHDSKLGYYLVNQ